MPEKILSAAETIAQLAQRRAVRVAQSSRRRVATADASASGRVAIRLGEAAAGHRFRVGQRVMLVPSRYGSNRHGGFAVTCLLPQEHGINQYRLKSVVDGHERVATEDELN